MYENLWQPYATPYQTRYNAPQQAFGSKLEVIRVNGKNGAEAFQMPPNSSIILLDKSAPLIWLKMTDGAGYPTLTPYRIEPLKSEPPVDMAALETRHTQPANAWLGYISSETIRCRKRAKNRSA